MGGARFGRFLVQRVLKMVAMVFAIIVANFLLVHAAPGDPASVMAGEAGAADPQFLAQLRVQFGLDQPLSTQLWIYVSHVAQGDLGVSYRQQRPVAGLILERLSATLLLTGTAFVLAIIGGITLGALAARRVGHTSDSLITVLALGFYATPTFWVGLMLVLVFSVWLDWLPSFGMKTVGADLTGGAALLDTARYLVLPGLTLGLFYMAVYARLTRAAMLEVASQDFVRTARAKGVPEGGVQRRHVTSQAVGAEQELHLARLHERCPAHVPGRVGKQQACGGCGDADQPEHDKACRCAAVAQEGAQEVSLQPLHITSTRGSIQA